MRFQCLNITCGRPFGWTAKKIVKDGDNTTYEYVICPYCGSLDFDEYRNGTPAKQNKTVPKVKDFAPANQFDPEDLMKHKWKGKKIGDREYAPAAESYGWDFTDQFLPATIDALNHSGTVAIGDREFELKGKLVAMKKVKQ